jgi:aryl-alcohol dehydrogenase-like predicted oxidoreductase
LQTDHIDLYQAHRFDYETPLEETLSAFDDLIRQGKVHYIGVSNWKHTEIQDALKIQDDKGYNRIVSNQPSYSAIYRVIEAKIVPLCEREGISQIVYSPLAQGVLTGKYQPGKKIPADSRGANKNNNGQFMQGMMNDDFLGHVAKLQPIADAHGITMSQLALAWILSNPNVASAITGGTKPKQVTENAKGSGIKLEAAVIKEINAVLKPITKTDPNLMTSPNPRA